MSTCQDTRQNHSDDLVTVYMGREDGPRTLCGYHAYANTAGYRHVGPITCVGCFRPVTDHARGCPTGQNGAPNYN